MDSSTLPHPPPIDDIHEAMRIVTEAVRDMPKPSMFQLAGEGFGTPFEQLDRLHHLDPDPRGDQPAGLAATVRGRADAGAGRRAADRRSSTS